MGKQIKHACMYVIVLERNDRCIMHACTNLRTRKHYVAGQGNDSSLAADVP